MGGCGGEEVVGGRVVLSQCVKTQSYMWKRTHVQYASKKTSRFRSVPFFFRLNRSGHFRSNRLPRANSFSARHEFVGKIHCVRWRSIARLFSTTTSRDGFFLP